MPAITKPNQHFDVSTYTGTGSALSVTNSGSFQPDWVWIKRRSGAVDHKLGDSVRGTTKYLISNTTDVESTEANGVTSFNSNGFTLGSGLAFNYTGETYVGWQWKAGGTAVTNTSGSISSQVSANPTAGFSVVTWTGNATGGATIGHGLGVAPSFVISKRRDAADDWSCYHVSLDGTKYIDLNSTAAAGTSIVVWNNTNPSSTVVTLGTSSRVNASGGTYVAYCFAPIAGYSAFGSYTGNGSADGPFVYLGFRPRFLMIKCSSAVESWYLFDTTRNTYNVIGEALVGNQSSAEFSFVMLDVLSNGFKARTTNSLCNTSSATYIYMAFAEAPQKYANAR